MANQMGVDVWKIMVDDGRVWVKCSRFGVVGGVGRGGVGSWEGDAYWKWGFFCGTVG